MSAPRLSVIVVAGEPGDGAFARRVLEDSGDLVLSAADVPEALGKLAQTAVDVALVSLSMPRGDGLALVHHLRALYPSLDVIAMSKPDEVAEASSAMALGVLSTLVTPLTGDEIRVAVDRARERRALLSERARLSALASSTQAHTARRYEAVARAARLMSESDPAALARRVLSLCAEQLDSRARAFYVAERAQGTLVRLVAEGDDALLPERLHDDSFETGARPPVFVREDELHLSLQHEGSAVGRVVLKLHHGRALDDAHSELLSLVGCIAAAAFVSAQRVDAVVRGGIRDIETSAYTFAYFGDLAAREIERAQRHHRPFALLTLHFAEMTQLSELLSGVELSWLRKAVTQALLSAVRESDVVARVDDAEQYLLLPETSRLGALACRRRIIDRLSRVALENASLPDNVRGRVESVLRDVAVGVSVFPVDGRDLGELLKLSRKRSERTRRGAWQKLGLSGKAFWECVEQLLDEAAAAEPSAGVGRGVELAPEALSHIALTLLRDAQRERIVGTLYLAGDAELSSQVARQVLSGSELSLRTWLLGPAHSVRDPAAEIRLPLTDSRLKTTSLVLWMTERGGYCLLGRKKDNGQLLAYHSSDLDLVEGLVNALQSTYHLQPELR